MSLQVDLHNFSLRSKRNSPVPSNFRGHIRNCLGSKIDRREFYKEVLYIQPDCSVNPLPMVYSHQQKVCSQGKTIDFVSNHKGESRHDVTAAFIIFPTFLLVPSITLPVIDGQPEAAP